MHINVCVCVCVCGDPGMHILNMPSCTVILTKHTHTPASAGACDCVMNAWLSSADAVGRIEGSRWKHNAKKSVSSSLDMCVRIRSSYDH